MTDVETRVLDFPLCGPDPHLTFRGLTEVPVRW